MKTKKIKKNLNFIIPILILLVISIVNMYGAAFISPLYNKALGKQVLWSIIGFIVMSIIYKIDFRIFLKYSFFTYVGGIALLILVLFFGKNVNGATSWFKIGPFSFQPSELFKFFYIIFLAKVINKHKGSSPALLIKIITVSFIPCILIFLEPDTGVVLMYLLIMLGMILESKVKKRDLYIIVSVFLIAIGLFLGFYFTEKDLFIEIFGTSFFYRMDRLLSFKNSSSYQLNNALIGIGSSGLTGLGLNSAKIYVPEITTDFVFDLTIFNFGYLMGFIVIGIYIYLLINIYKEISRSKKYLHRCILSGIFYMMFFQVAEHILMNLGLTPITGITLPFLSYGGSSLLSYFMLFALILKITTSNSSYN